MCIQHCPQLLEEWLPKKRFRAYKVIRDDNRSAVFRCEKTWTVGIHKISVSPLQSNNVTTTGYYVYLLKAEAIRDRRVDEKLICVYVDPQDVVYAGPDPTARSRVFVCRKVEVKSLEGLKLTGG
jgi:hypothetical protein